MSKKLMRLVLPIILTIMLVSPFNFVTAQTSDMPPLPSGSYKVGVEWLYWVDQSRDETLGQKPQGKRELMIEVLYPTDAITDASRVEYMINRDTVLPAFNDLITQNGIALTLDTTSIANFKTHSYLNVPLSKNQVQYPVLIFSHGAGGEVTMYTAQLEDLASHGYVVVAINHTYVASATVFPDGRNVKFDLSKGLDGVTPIMSQDQQFVMDQLAKLNESDPNDLFTNHLDLSRIGIAGHSVGGAAATMTCFLDKRCIAGVNEDGPVFGDVIPKGVSQPFLYMLSDHRFFYDPSNYKNARGPYYEISLKGFEHLDFGDFTLWGKLTPLHDAMWLGSVDSTRAATVVRAYVLAFFEKYLKGNKSLLLDGPSSDYPEVTIQSHGT